MASVDVAELPTGQDIAIGFVTGVLPEAGWPRARLAPAAALRAALRPALERTPCVIGFSGGRDSALLLALAVDEARRAGLAPPIPVTLEFDSEASREDEWQTLLLEHLGLSEWIRLPQGDALDMLGPVATDGLRRCGVMYPANAHMTVPLARVARGGSVVTGVGGDEVLGAWPFERMAAVVAGRRSPRPADLRGAVGWALPGRVRASRYAQGVNWVQLPWLRPPYRARAAVRIATDMAGSPRTWSARMRWLARRRLWAVSARASARHAADHGAVVVEPLLDHGFLASLAGAGGRLGLGDRTAVTRLVADGLLPEQILTRQTKAEFSEPYFGSHTKRFARAWDGHTGIDENVIDAAALRETWLSDHPHGCAAALLQTAWLATETATRPSATAIAQAAGDG